MLQKKTETVFQGRTVNPMLKEYWTHPNGCPRLFLAPMEGIGDLYFRRSIISIGGFDEASTEFLRVPRNAHVQSLAKKYHSDEISPFPLAAQIMGDDIELLPAMGRELEKRGAHRIDLNCGCPSNIVVGRGAGSSLLRDPDRLFRIVKSLVDGVNSPVSCKLRSGYSDTSLFKENLFAVQESGVTFITLHPRTKEDGYRPPAKWELIAEAKQLLKIPVVGSGDIVTAKDAQRMHTQTQCDGLMVGRGAVMNPWIFHQILASYSELHTVPNWSQTEHYLRLFSNYLAEEAPFKTQVNKLKQMINYLFKCSDELQAQLPKLLTLKPTKIEDFVEMILIELHRNWNEQP